MALLLRRGIFDSRNGRVIEEGRPFWETTRSRLFVGDGASEGGVQIGVYNITELEDIDNSAAAEGNGLIRESRVIVNDIYTGNVDGSIPEDGILGFTDTNGNTENITRDFFVSRALQASDIDAGAGVADGSTIVADGGNFSVRSLGLDDIGFDAATGDPGDAIVVNAADDDFEIRQLTLADISAEDGDQRDILNKSFARLSMGNLRKTGEDNFNGSIIHEILSIGSDSIASGILSLGSANVTVRQLPPNNEELTNDTVTIATIRITQSGWYRFKISGSGIIGEESDDGFGARQIENVIRNGAIAAIGLPSNNPASAIYPVSAPIELIRDIQGRGFTNIDGLYDFTGISDVNGANDTIYGPLRRGAWFKVDSETIEFVDATTPVDLHFGFVRGGLAQPIFSIDSQAHTDEVGSQDADFNFFRLILGPVTTSLFDTSSALIRPIHMTVEPVNLQLPNI